MVGDVFDFHFIADCGLLKELWDAKLDDSSCCKFVGEVKGVLGFFFDVDLDKPGRVKALLEAKVVGLDAVCDDVGVFVGPF